ncbi:MAG: hypothetical protein IKO80_09610 [Lachnospiraceae bacterium]|nr:hypothetical protein [Lachnospiraceae bacterium]
MKIKEASFSLAAAGHYEHEGAGRTGSYKEQEDYASLFRRRLSGKRDEASDPYANYSSRGDLLSNGFRERTVGTGRGSSALMSAGNFRYALLSLIMNRLFRIFGMSAGTDGGYLQSYEYEYEEMQYSAQGVAVTEDGRRIGFDINLYMSREFLQYTKISTPALAGALMDPLIINTGSGITQVSDQTFRFDLDADGKEEEVKLPSAGCGFLALDRDGNGRIDDGSELFGTRSGDGFGDLAAYDSDGNGWIDENDEIFDRLKVWYKNGDGSQELLDLKQADIGAICLKEQRTDFALKDAMNRTKGMIRSTGFFLRESGGAGLVQHVDLAASGSV